MRILLLILVGVVLAGCVHLPNEKERASADYGEFPEKYQEIVKKHYEGILLQPSEALYSDWTGPSKGFRGSFAGSDMIFGYKTCVTVHVRNSLGDYVLFGREYFLIRNNRIITIIPGSSSFCNF